MKAAVVHQFGSAPVYEDFADPVAEEGEELVRVAAAGLHPLVRSLAAGRHYASEGQLPFIPGVDGIARTPDGRPVYFGRLRAPYGTMAERAAASKLCFPIPDALAVTKAAAIMNPGLSSWLALRERAQIQAGETVLVTGATGAAGRLALQVARKLGAGRVIAAGRDRLAVEALHADAHVVLGSPDTERVLADVAAKGIDVVLDYVWGEHAAMLLRAIARARPRRTRFVQIGSMAGETIELPSAVLRQSPVVLLGSGLGSVGMDAFARAIPAFVEVAPSLDVEVVEVPLGDVARVWNEPTGSKRVVFVP